VSWPAVDPVPRLVLMACLIIDATLLVACAGMLLEGRVDRRRLAATIGLCTPVLAARLFTPMPDWTFCLCLALLVAAGRFWRYAGRRS
jgi:hypothetical protein